MYFVFLKTSKPNICYGTSLSLALCTRGSVFMWVEGNVVTHCWLGPETVNTAVLAAPTVHKGDDLTGSGLQWPFWTIHLLDMCRNTLNIRPALQAGKGGGVVGAVLFLLWEITKSCYLDHFADLAHQRRGSAVVTMSACHAGGRGSLPVPGTLLGVKTWLSTLEIWSLCHSVLPRFSKGQGAIWKGHI